MSILRVFDCFCGLGGISMGAKLGGHRIVGGIDASESAIKAFGSNFPEAAAVHADVRDKEIFENLKDQNLRNGDVDVLVGGPPCQAFSVNNHKRGLDDPRSSMVGEYLKVLDHFQPSWLVIENVPGILSIGKGRLLREFINELSARKFHVQLIKILASNFGVPQTRKRILIIGSKDKAHSETVAGKLIAKKSKLVSVWDAIGDLPLAPGQEVKYARKANGGYQRIMRRNCGSAVEYHYGHNLGAVNAARVCHIPQGGNWRDIPRELLPKGMKRAKLSDHTTRYGRLVPENTSHTILTKCDPHWGCYLHPFEDRVITIREAARLQSIPDSFNISKKISSAYRLVGNAVPPLVAKSVFDQINKYS